MIINNTYKFAFIHIPKCGGTHAKQQLLKFDDLQGQFTDKIETHRELGLIDYVHIPLEQLKQYFPTIYEKIEEYESFCLIRNPQNRFPSSVNEYSKKHTGTHFNLLGRNHSFKLLDRIMKELLSFSNHIVLPYTHIHFQCQHSYIYINDKKVIKNVYNELMLDDMIKDIYHLTGERYISNSKNSASNKSVKYRSEALRRFFTFFKPYLSQPARSVFPDSFFLTLDKLVLTDTTTKTHSIFQSNEVRSFINTYYKDDMELYKRLG